MALKLKPLVVAIATALPILTLAYSANAEEAKKEDNSDKTGIADVSKQAAEQEKAANESDPTKEEEKLEDISTNKPPATLVFPYFPIDSKKYRNDASWRFGIWRQYKGRYHFGIDFSRHGSRQLVVGAEGQVKLGATDGSSVGNLILERPNGDHLLYMHLNNYPSRGVRPNKLQAGESAGIMGNTGMGYSRDSDSGVHLHFEYHVPCESGRVRFTGFAGGVKGRTYGPGRPRYSQLGRVYKTGTNAMSSVGSTGRLCITDPTPYLPDDRVFNGTMALDGETGIGAYLGNSLRSQYNALYNPTPNLPLGAGAKAATKKIPNLPIYHDTLSPEEIAALRSGGVAGAVFGAGGGYDLNGQYMSYRMLTSFIPDTDGDAWATLPPPSKPVSVEKMTPKEIIEHVADRRFGNAKWESAISGLSSKALLTEYLMMETEKNFLKQQNAELKARVEMLLAGLTQAKLFEFNKKIETMQIKATADSVPTILDVKMNPMYGYGSLAGGVNLPVAAQQSWDEVDKNDLNALLNYFLVAVTHGESKSYDAFNYGSAPCPGYSTTEGARAEDRAQGRARHVSESSVEELYQNRKTVKYCSHAKRFAIGRYQFTPDPFTEFRTYVGRSKASNMIFDAPTQDYTARWRVLDSIRGNLRDFVIGKHKDLYKAALDAHNEWRSIGKPSRDKPPSQWVESTHTNTANVTSNLMVVQALLGIQEWHSKFGHLGKVTIDPVTLTLITPKIPSVYANGTGGGTDDVDKPIGEEGSTDKKEGEGATETPKTDAPKTDAKK